MIVSYKAIQYINKHICCYTLLYTLHHIILYCIIRYHAILYYTVLYDTILRGRQIGTVPRTFLKSQMLPGKVIQGFSWLQLPPLGQKHGSLSFRHASRATTGGARVTRFVLLCPHVTWSGSRPPSRTRS